MTTMRLMQEINKIAEALVSHRWQFAKTVPESPHWYTLRQEWDDDFLFEQVVRYIRANGYADTYAGHQYVKWNHGGFQYWTMGAPVSETILINRARITRTVEDKPVDE